MKIPFKYYFLNYLIFLILLSEVTLLLWITDKTENDVVLTSDQILRYIGQLTGIIGLILMSLNFILATRFKIVESLLGGLDKVYVYHIITGTLAYLFIFLHPLALVLRLEDINLFKSFYIISGDNLPRDLGITAFWILIFLIFISFLRFLPYNLWKWTHKLMGLTIILGGLHSVLIQERISSSAELKLWTAFWAVLGVITWIYKEFFYPYFLNAYRYTIVKVDIHQNITDIYLEPDNNQLKFKAGQFVFVRFLNNKIIGTEEHPFTITSSPEDRIMRLSIKSLGNWSNKITNANQFDKVIIKGPYGTFHKECFSPTPKQLWVGGGIGIAPFLSMAHEELVQKSCNQVNLIYSTKEMKVEAYRSELEEIDKRLEHFTITHHYSDTEGFLNIEYIEKINGGLADTTFLLCGPTPMVKIIKDGLKAKGVKSNRIIYEIFEFR